MRTVKLALALAFAAVSPVIAPTSAMANVEAEVEAEGGGGGLYSCTYQYSFFSLGVMYNVYRCVRIL
jgi:hypothetical protein